MAAIGLGRPGTAEDIAPTAVYLASDMSAYVTGQVIGVDGGLIDEVLVAPAEIAARRDSRGLGGANRLQGEVSVAVGRKVPHVSTPRVPTDRRALRQ